jgi:hypothetical protein
VPKLGRFRPGAAMLMFMSPHIFAFSGDAVDCDLPARPMIVNPSSIGNAALSRARRSTVDVQRLVSDEAGAIAGEKPASDRAGVNLAAHPARNGGLRDGSMSMCWRRCRVASTAGHAAASGDGRASVRHIKDADGGNALLDEASSKGRQRNSAPRPGLQPDQSNEHHRCSAADNRNHGIGKPRKLPASLLLPVLTFSNKRFDTAKTLNGHAG